MKVAKQILKITGRVLLAVFALLLFVWLLIQTSPVQNFIIGKITAKLSKNLHTEVRIKHVSLSLFDKINLEGTLVRDHHHDTLLYAGAVKVRITDWFFVTKNLTVRYAGLEDAVINLHRKDSVWNYQFIADYFSSSDPSSTKDTATSSPSKPIRFGLEKVDLKNVNFIQNDEWRGQKMQIQVGSLLMQADSVNIDKNKFVISSLDIDKPLFALYDFEGLRPDSLRPKSIDTGLYFNESGLELQVKKINLTNGAFISERQDSLPINSYFDGEHIHISKLNGTIQNFSFLQDTIAASINLSAHERSGFELKKLKASFRLTPQIMEFKELDLRTPKSRIGNYYAMKFDDFIDDMNEYIDSVTMDANFKNSTVSSDDIAFFAPELKNWKQQAEISGHFKGKVVDFSVPDLFIRSGSGMYATGELKMKGLPNIDNTVITLNGGNVQMTYTDLITIIPQLKDITSPNLASLGLFRYNGNFNGTLYKFSANGNISSAIGGISANINMQFPDKGEPHYNGKINTQQFDLGKFVNTPTIGLVSFNGSVSGSSFDIDKIKTVLNGTFSRFDFNDYSFSNIDFNGTIQNKFFNGDLKISDPNFDFTSNVEIDLTQSQPKFNVLGDLAKSNLKALHLINENFQLAGLFDLNFQGRNIDEFRGYAKVLNAVLLHDSTRLSFDSLAITSYDDSINKRVLFAQSNEFDVMVSGQYNILDLPNSFQAFLNHYYPSYINKPKTTPKNQNFSVAINTRDFDNYAQVIDARLHGLDNAQLTGRVNTEDSGAFAISAYVPDFGWQNVSVENATFRGTGNFVSLNVTGNVDKIQVSDSTYFPNTKLSVQSANDHSVVHVETSANNTLNDAQLNADVYTLPDGVKVDFQPSSFIINEKKWDLEKEGEIVVRKNFATAQNVKFVQGFQEITIEPDDTQQSKGNSLVVRLKDVNVGDFTPIFTKEPRMEGIANGDIYLSDFYGNFRMEADVKAEQFRLNDDSIGVVNANAAYNIANGNVDFSAQSANPVYNFDISGGINVKDTTGAGVNVAMHLNKTKIGIVNMFLSDLFSNITGLATGDLSVISNKDGLNLKGIVSVQNAGITVNYTQVRYTIDSARFVFTDAGIDFGTFIVKDNSNRTGTVRGRLIEHDFTNMQYDFDMATDKLLLLNTTAKDNQEFYGRAIGKATLSLKGPQENMKLTITGAVNDTTHIYIPTGNSSKSSAADFVVFKQYGILQKEASTGEQSNLSIDLDLTANHQAQIDVILDPVTGDIIKATGNGRMQIKVPATGSMSMKGRYNIEHGDYDFNFQSFLRRPFELLPDSYIEWNGDPYDADIHIDAQYTAERVSINDLISNQSATNNVDNAFSNVSGYRGDVYVIAQLREKLTQPKITFRLDFPQGSAIKSDNNFNLFLARLQSDDNEMLKQVTYLIVFNSFAPYGEVTGASTNAYSLGVNTLSQKITSEVNKIISNVLYKITGDKNLQLDIAASTYSSSTISGTTSYTGSSVLDRQQIGLKINKSLLDGKVIITFGGDFDFGISNASASQTSNFQWLPDVSVQIILSKDRKLRAIVFNRSSLTVAGNTAATGSLGRSTRQGVSLSYTKDFEKLKDLFKSKKESSKK